ncbi:huntingtin-like isoform X1 [Saccostrea echinata]|uniref:huntingtin-like isoform X1 n=1 Tax=Saccostrea echinata TaxID=191078 RepID=UPI002A810451|nr:huntingtin-like isoform X1 [Saccostrea echinata]
MATIEKLIKAFEALRVFQPPGSTTDDLAKKKEQAPVSKKDKMINCNLVADSICAPNMRAIVDFPKFLGIAMETFLTLCDDAESDVRMVADECLNRSIKILLETNLGRLQVELYKEIKKNGSSRTLRAALWRFSEMAHLIRPQKCRPYIVNLLPCIARICKREDEAIQDTLSQSMQKICPPLIGFANESEIKALIKSFLPNLRSTSAATRRMAATSLVLICEHSRSPSSFYNHLLGSLLDMVMPVDEETSLHTLIGVLLCLRSLIPHLNESGQEKQGLKGSFGVMTKEKEQTISKEQFIMVIQLLLHLMGHSDHNVVTGALETFQQLLRNPSPLLVSILTTPKSITRSYIFKADQSLQPGEGLSEVPSMSKMYEDNTAADELEVTESIVDPSEGSEDNVSDIVANYRAQMSRDQSSEAADNDGVPLDVDTCDAGIVVTTLDTRYSGIEIGDLNEDMSEKSNLSQVSSANGSQQSLNKLSLPPKAKRGGGQDMNGNPELEEDVLPEVDEKTQIQNSIQIDVTQNLGSLLDDVPLDFCIRVICRRFLLSGTKEQLIPDRTVRVSIKVLALGCVSYSMTFRPQILFMNVFKEINEENNQLIKDVLLFASHIDPQLKGTASIIIGNLISSTLTQGGGNFNKWMEEFVFGYSVRIEHLVEIILHIMEDESSVAVRLAVLAVKKCLMPLLLGTHSPVGLETVIRLLSIQDNPYWLVKVEILEIVSCVNFNVLNHLESCCSEVQRGTNHFLGKLHIQDRIVLFVMEMLGNDDIRVRHCASETLVKIVPRLFYPCDHPQHDPIITESRLHTEKLLSPMVSDSVLNSPPLVLGLVKPYTDSNGVVSPSIESNLSRVVKSALHQLNVSQSKHLTFGCCHALFLLSEAFPATLYAHSWGCGPCTSFLPKEASNKGIMKRPPSRSHSNSRTVMGYVWSGTFSLDEMSAGSGGGALTIILPLLTSSNVSLDLAAHSDTLQFAGNLVAGAVYRCMQPVEESNSTNDGEGVKWGAVSDRLLIPFLDQLLFHIARVLNCCVHVIDEQVPGPAPVKPSLPSLPNAPSLSPIKRKNKGDSPNDSPAKGSNTDTKTPTKQQKEKEKEQEKEKEKTKKDSLGVFHSLPHYMKLYDVLKGAYSNYKVSLDLMVTDKFCSLLHTSLVTLSQILEIARLEDIGKYADEILQYLKSTVVLEPTESIQCVQQLLKALFGTNLVCQWEPQHLVNLSGKPGKAARLTGNNKPGQYYFCFTQPYTQFTQSLAGATFKASSHTDQEEGSGTLSTLRKCVDRKFPAILKPSSKTDKSTVASYIRLFEPLVIKALKQYTVSSSLELQQQVLDLLSQLIQLRVNYCLLDSDQVFIGFIIKQLEFIEEGQIRNSENLIPNIFSFLVMLSYEKTHSKTIIGMPKIIQLCDGIMASGLQPVSHAIPALRPVVFDLFLLRGGNKPDISRDLETQREVLVSMLLRLIQYYQTLDLLVVVLQQSKKESEDRWKRLSRLITDSLLPALTANQVNLDNGESLDVLHRLFECLAPIVFRPVDILLKTLLQAPSNIGTTENLQRWMCLVLSVVRVLMAQSKEEVILSRLTELRIKLTLFKVHSSKLTEEEKQMVQDMVPEQILARFLVQVIGKCLEVIMGHQLSYHGSRDHTDFLSQQLSQFLLYITHMFQSGMFRKVATCALQIASEEAVDCFYSIKEVNRNFLSVSMTLPTLTLQWCNILILLNYDDQNLWSEVMQTPNRHLKPGTSQSTSHEAHPVAETHCCNQEILRRGGIILFCDFVCENMLDAEHMTWLVINHVSDLIQLSRESPVQDFVSAIHRNSAASCLFIQAIHSRGQDVSKPSQIKKTMKCVEAIHLSQTGALLTLLIDKFLNTHHLSVARLCDTIACHRVEMLLADNFEDAKKQLPLVDLDKLLKFMETHSLLKRHARLVSLLQKLRGTLDPETSLSLYADTCHPVLSKKEYLHNQMDKDLYLSIVKYQCSNPDSSPRECGLLLHKLEYADMLAIMMTKEFSLDILSECLTLGAQYTLIKSTDSVTVLDSEGNQVLQEPVTDNLFQAAQLTLTRHINNVINLLPAPHQILTFSSFFVKESRYQEKMNDIFSDTSWKDMIFSLTKTLNCYLQAMDRLPWKPDIPVESHCDICKFSVLCMELLCWMFHNDILPTSEQLNVCLKCTAVILQNQQLSAVIGQKDRVSWIASIASSIYQVFLSLVLIPGDKLVTTSQESFEEPSGQNELSVIVKACDQISELVQYLLFNKTSHSIPYFLDSHLTTIIISLARLPALNSYARTPSLVWKLGWTPTPSGELKTHLPPLPVDYLKDKDVLKEFVSRINTLGWISRQQFEETWMSLLAVLNPVIEDVTEHISPEEEIERSQCMVIAVKAITAMLLQSTLTPVPGNPSNSVYEVRPRDKPLGFLHTRCGKKLTIIRGIIEREVQDLYRKSEDNCSSNLCEGEDREILRYMFDNNLERETGDVGYNLGQVSIESIWSVVGALHVQTADSDTPESLNSPEQENPENAPPPPIQQQFPLVNIEKRERSISLSGLDIHSCLQFLLELYGQWLSPNSILKPPLMLKNEVVKSLVSLSDLFVEREQYEWMLDFLFDIYKAHPSEDEIVMQYINVGLSKAAAVIGLDSSGIEKLMKLLDTGLRSPHLPSRTAAMHGILYLLEAGMQEITKPLVPMATDFLLRNLGSISQTCITSQQYILTMWATAFYIMENYHVDLKDLEFPSKVLQLAVSTASGNEESVSTPVYLAILKGLERLLLTDVLSQQDAEAIVKLGVDRLCLPSPQRSLAALGLMFTCMYSGKQYDQYSPLPRDAPAYDFNIVYQDPESLILAMERVTVLFDRIKKGYPYEARVITLVLPTFLADFFPPQDIMNKIIGEFISSQQPYPQLIAMVVFQVFNNLHIQNQEALVQNWVMLSLSNFTQRTPVSMATWSLTCFFISASTNSWLRPLINHVINRMGRMETVDQNLFCMAALDFYCILKDKQQQWTFISTFQNVSSLGPPYTDLLERLEKAYPEHFQQKKLKSHPLS